MDFVTGSTTRVSSTMPSGRKSETKAPISSFVNQVSQSIRLSTPSSSALLLWQKNMSGISKAPGFSACASKSFCPICEALDIRVVAMTMPFSLPTELLNSSIRRFIGESACSPYTCHRVSVTGLSGFSSDFCPQPDAQVTNTRERIRRSKSLFFISTSIELKIKCYYFYHNTIALLSQRHLWKSGSC